LGESFSIYVEKKNMDALLQVKNLESALCCERQSRDHELQQMRQTEASLREALSAAYSEAQQLRSGCNTKEAALLDEVAMLSRELKDTRRSGKTSEALAEEVKALDKDLQRCKEEQAIAEAQQGELSSTCDSLRKELEVAKQEAVVWHCSCMTSTLIRPAATSVCANGSQVCAWESVTVASFHGTCIHPHNI
jgi:predicted RNase H-like nuclease (RuvC/YqgF family)